MKPSRERLLATGAAALIALGLGVAPAQASTTTIDFEQASALNSRLQSGTIKAASLSSAEIDLLAFYAKPAREVVKETTSQIALTDPSVATAIAEIRAESGSAAAAKTTCLQKRGERTAYGIPGNKLYMSYHVGKWCYTTTGPVSIITVTSSKWVDGGGQTYWFGWENHGLINKGAGVVHNSGRSYSQHSFKNPLIFQSVQPCVRVRGGTSGTVDHVCGIG